jgi:hypothetical protein
MRRRRPSSRHLALGQDRRMGGHRKRRPDRDRNSDQHLAVCEVGTVQAAPLHLSPAPRTSSPALLSASPTPSVAGVRLNSWKSVRVFKGIICGAISEFESYHPSHAVGLRAGRNTLTRNPTAEWLARKTPKRLRGTRQRAQRNVWEQRQSPGEELLGSRPSSGSVSVMECRVG